MSAGCEGAGGRGAGGRSQWPIASQPPTPIPQSAEVGRGAPAPPWHSLRRPGFSKRDLCSSFPQTLRARSPAPPPQLSSASGAEEERGVWKRLPLATFPRDFLFSPGPPAQLARALQALGVRAPRTWPESETEAVFVGKHLEPPGFQPVGRNTCMVVRASGLPVWPCPGTAAWHLGPLTLRTHQPAPRVLERAGKPGQNKGEGGEIAGFSGRVSLLTQQGLLEKEC